MNLQIVATERFENVPLNIYGTRDRTFYMTREEIGLTLGYANPKKAIEKLQYAHSDRFSVLPKNGVKLKTLAGTFKLKAADGKMYDTVVYTLRGVMEICRWSRQPKADAFMDFVWDVMEQLGSYQATPKTPPPDDFLEACGTVTPEKAETDQEIAARFLSALQAALQSGEYYLLPKYRHHKTPREGTLLGIYDDDFITLIAVRAWEVYARATGSSKPARSLSHTLWPILSRAGLFLPRVKADQKRVIKGKRCCAIHLRRKTVHEQIPGSVAFLPSGS